MENLKGREYSEDPDADGKAVLEWMLGTLWGKARNGCIWLRNGASGGLPRTR